MAKAVVQHCGVPVVPLQETFDATAEKAPSEYWLWDGIRPTFMGHELIKRAWVNAFRALKIE